MIEKLIEQIKNKKSPIVVGLDPQLELLPPHLLPESESMDLGNVSEAVLAFNKELIDAVADIVPAVKPQIAFYERLGLSGLSAYQQTIRYAHEKGLFVIADVKRGDIGSTSKAYADAHLGKVRLGDRLFPVFNADFATINPYMGGDSLQPFFDVCKEEGKGLFILVKTSNPGSVDFQNKFVYSEDDPADENEERRGLEEGNRKTLYAHMGEHVERWGERMRHGQYSDIGAVVGATHPEEGKLLRKLLPHTFFLVPGYGAQGAKGQDLAGFFDAEGSGAIVNSSRGIIGAWQKKEYERFGGERFAEAAREAVLAMREDIAANVPGLA